MTAVFLQNSCLLPFLSFFHQCKQSYAISCTLLQQTHIRIHDMPRSYLILKTKISFIYPHPLNPCPYTCTDQYHNTRTITVGLLFFMSFKLNLLKTLISQ